VSAESIWDGVISFSVQDNNVAGAVDGIIGQLQSKIAELNKMPGVEVGQQIFGSFESGAAGASRLIEQLKLQLNELNAAGRGLQTPGVGNLNPEAYREQIALTRQLVAGTENAIRSVEQLAKAQLEVAATAVKAPYVDPGMSVRNVNPYPNAYSYEGADQAAAMGRTGVPGGGPSTTSPELAAAEAARIRDLASGRVAEASVIDGATALGAAEIRSATALMGVEKAEKNLGNDEIDATVRIKALLTSWRESTNASLALEKAQLEAAAAIGRVTLVAPVGVNTSGVDPDQPAKIQQLQLDLAINTAKETQLRLQLESNIAEGWQLGAIGKGAVTEAEMAQAQIKTLASQERLQAAVAKQADEAAGGSGGGGANAITMLKYYAFYQVFQMGQSAITAVKTATEEYSLAVNQLSIALGVSYDQAQKTAAGYAQIGQGLATPPAVAVTAATQFTRFFQDNSGASGDVGAQLGSTINLLEGRNAAQGQEQAMVTKALDEVAAIAHNYDMGASGASDIYSAATVIAQHYGQTGGSQLTTGTAQIADLLKMSGFSADQGLALVGQVVQSTGTTSDMAAGDLKRLFGRSGSNTFQSLFSQYDINPNQSVKGEMGQLSLKFQDLDPTQQTAIIQKLGGGRSGAAALATIVDFQSIMAEGQKAAADPNAAKTQADLKLATFAGQIETIKTDLLELATDLGSSGLGGSFTLLLAGVDPLVRGLDATIQGLDLLPGWFNTAAVGVTALGIAFRVLGTQGMTDTLTKVSQFGPFGKSADKVAAVAPVAYTTAAESAAVSAAAATDLRVAADARLSAAEKAVTDAEVGSAEERVAASRELVAAQAEVTATTGEAATAIRAQIVADAELVTAAAAAAAGEEKQAAAGGLAALGTAAGGAVLAMAPIVAILAAIALYGGAKSAADTGAQGVKDAISGAAAGDAGVKSGSVSQIQTAIAGLNASTTDINSSSSGMGGGFLFAVGDIATLGGLSDAQNKALGAIAAKRNELQAALADLQAKQKAVSDASPGSDLFGQSYSNVDMGIRLMKSGQLSPAASSKALSALFANTNAGTAAGDVTAGQEFNPVSGTQGVADEIKRVIAVAGRAINPLDQQAQLETLLPHIAEMQAVASKISDPMARGDALSSAQDQIDIITKAVSGNLVKLTTDRIASIKAMSSNQGANDTQIRALLTSSMNTEANLGDVTSLVALANVGDVAFLKNFGANLHAQDQIAHDHLATAQAAANAALASAKLQADAAAPGLAIGGGLHILPTDPAGLAAAGAGQKKADGFRAQIAANDKAQQDARTQIPAAAAAAGETQAQADAWLKLTEQALVLQKEALVKQLDAVVVANAEAAAQNAMLASLMPSTGTSGAPAGTFNVPGTGAQPGVSAPKPAGPVPMTPAQQKALDYKNQMQAISDQADKAMATFNAAMSIAAPSGSALAPGKAVTDAYAAQEAMLAAQATSGDPVSQAAAALRVAQYKMTEGGQTQAQYWQNLKALHDAQYALGQAEMGAASAQISSSAISGDPMSAAIVALQVAQNQLNSAVGATAYYGALKSLHDAQYALGQAQMTAANDAYQLGLDLTNPLVVAREKVVEAQRQLAFDQGRGALPDVTNKDALALKQAKSAADKAAFDQQFSDQSTNYNLQRESLSAYLSYLNAQHNYLTAVHSKTRQQVDELNQVDQALQGLANAMQGQFNLGAIKVPTVYEARAAGQGSMVSNTVQITINGTDIPAVKAILATYVGPAAMSTAGSVARKV
jgi:hypothetical protein